MPVRIRYLLFKLSIHMSLNYHSCCSMVEFFTPRWLFKVLTDHVRFSPGKFGGGAYLTVNSKVGSLIDWYNVQVSHVALNFLIWYLPSFESSITVSAIVCSHAHLAHDCTKQRDQANIQPAPAFWRPRPVHGHNRLFFRSQTAVSLSLSSSLASRVSRAMPVTDLYRPRL